MTTPTYDEAKFAELVLYLCLRSEGDPHFGATKLNKLLFYSDFTAYAATGRAITGAVYQKLEFGPAPVRLMPVKSALVEAGAAAERSVEVAGMTQKRLLALRQPNLENFTGREIDIADRVIEALLPYNATEVSDLSHNMSGWKLAALKQPIPYFTVCIPATPLPLSQAEIAFGLEVARRTSLRSAPAR